jgi:hypothetical protein
VASSGCCLVSAWPLPGSRRCGLVRARLGRRPGREWPAYDRGAVPSTAGSGRRRGVRQSPRSRVETPHGDLRPPRCAPSHSVAHPASPLRTQPARCAPNTKPGVRRRSERPIRRLWCAPNIRCRPRRPITPGIRPLWCSQHTPSELRAGRRPGVSPSRSIPHDQPGPGAAARLRGRPSSSLGTFPPRSARPTTRHATRRRSSRCLPPSGMPTSPATPGRYASRHETAQRERDRVAVRHRPWPIGATRQRENQGHGPLIAARLGNPKALSDGP